MNRLLPLILLAASAVAHAADVETFVAETSGSIVLAADGRVVSVELDGADVLGAETIADYEELVGGWQVKPVVRDGRPVAARGHLRLSLVAQREPGSDRATLGVRNAWFVDPPRTPRTEAGSATASLPPPVYPRGPMSAGVGAEVMLLLQLAEDGS